ncbi:MAG: precorrin-2/cobalt-factor-2 C20-methyltransferase [Desulfonauticus sp.]|nr:MAG: Precorrin-2 C20-methyltransferase [Desulfonauticus sp. 38_4375]MDK2920907.1 precorrin-2/cobalt-factor-2 C20-methyltransferase [Desulfonauticus sp.]
MKSFQVKKGHFYALGVGPGSADLLTLRAVKVLQEAEVIFCPASLKKQESLALKIISPYVQEQQIRVVSYPMQKNSSQTWAHWQKIATEIVKLCEQDKVVAQVTLGDPLFYSTSCYLLSLLQPLLKKKIHVVPGITAFQAASARFNLPLSLQEDSFLLLPGSDVKRLEKALTCCETLVIYKAGKNLKSILDLLEKKGLLADTYLVAYVEQEEEYLVHQPSPDIKLPGYLVTIIVKLGHKPWTESENRT